MLLEELKWIRALKKDPIYREVVATRDELMEEKGYDWFESTQLAIHERRFLLNRLFKEQRFPGEWKLLMLFFIVVITLAPRKLLLPVDLVDQTRTGFYSDLLIVHWQTGIPFQKTWDVWLIMFLKLHCLNILNLRFAWCDISCSCILLFAVLYFEF